jgi:hypothetical protein
MRMSVSRRRTLVGGSVAAIAALAAMMIGPASGPAAAAHRGCADLGVTTFKFELPDGVTIKPTHGATKRGPSKIKMANCSGNFDNATGTGSLVLLGGINFKFESNRGPTGDYRIRFGGVGKLRARVVGSPANIAKVSGGDLSQVSGVTHRDGANLKLTTKGANLLNKAVDSSGGPWSAGFIGTVSTLVPQA